MSLMITYRLSPLICASRDPFQLLRVFNIGENVVDSNVRRLKQLTHPPFRVRTREESFAVHEGKEQICELINLSG